MSKLVLKFETAILKEVAVGHQEVSIGRSPDNSIVIDNPAISSYHARVFHEDGRLMLQDFGSLNGTFVNGQRVKTVMLDTKDRREFLRQVAAVGESAQPAPGRIKLPTLVVRKGSTDRHEYTLTDKLTVVGKSAMATVKLKGWFKPKAAAQINRREDNSYYLGPADKVPSVNGTPISHPTKLQSGDVIVVAGVELEFVVRD